MSDKRIGGDKFILITRQCKSCGRYKYYGVSTHIQVCPRCDIPHLFLLSRVDKEEGDA